jgi:hypothetical protein
MALALVALFNCSSQFSSSAGAANGAVFRADYNLTNDSSDEHQDISNILFSTLLEKKPDPCKHFMNK